MAVVVGQRVRVAPSASDGVSRRALVLALEGEDKLEIEYEDTNEEAVVATAVCSALLEFEEAPAAPSDEGPVAGAERLKANGNALFKLRDATAAIECYVAALKSLQTDAPLSCGARCLVKPAGGEASVPLRSATVLALDASGADIAYEPDAVAVTAHGADVSKRLAALMRLAEAVQQDGATDGVNEASSSSSSADAASAPAASSSWFPGWWSSSSQPADKEEAEEEEEEEEEEDGVARERVAMVVHATQPALQCALLLNSAKCSLLAKAWSAALARALRAERIAAHDEAQTKLTRPMRRTALIVCARSALGMRKFGRATNYAARLLAAAPADGADANAAASKEIRTLLRDIQRSAVETKRSNRALAKALSEFVTAAMEASGQSDAAAGVPSLT